MFKKLLGIMLAVILAVSPVATFATNSAEGETPVVVTETFNNGEIPSAWSGGAFSSDDYGYLKFTANEAGATLTRELGIEEGSAFTVDFRVMVESGSATASAGGYSYELGSDFAPGLWYNVRVASAGSTADVYIDGASVSTGTSFDFENAFEITANQACVIGIDDFKVYNSKLEGNSGMSAEVLNMTFDGFAFTGTSGTLTPTSIENMKAHYDSSTVIKEKEFQIELSNNMVGGVQTGKFGKSTADNAFALTHSAYSSTKPNAAFDVALGDGSHLYKEGDTQVLSFNVACDDEETREFRMRYYPWYKSEEDFLRGGKTGVGSSSVTKDDGYLLSVENDRVFVFGDDNARSYSIIPALMPNQWNNIRLEITAGDGNTTAFTYNLYINDILIAEDVAVAQTAYYVRDINNNAKNTLGAFYGFNRLSFEYKTSNTGGYDTAGGFYFDDIKVENYYQTEVPAKVASPLLKGDNVLPGTNTDISGTAFTNWDYDKWVTGPVVYVDKDMTLAQYKEHLNSIGKNLGVTFRNADGSAANDTDEIGNLKYAEIIKTNYERMYVSLVGENKTLKTHCDDVASITSTSAVGTFYSSSYASLSEVNGVGGRVAETDKSASVTANATGQDATVRYALHSRDSSSASFSSYTNSSSDAYRPVTFESSVLMPDAEDGYAQIAGRYYDAQWNTANNITTSSSVQNTFTYLEGGLITIGARVSATDSNNDVKIIGTYNPGEWVKISVTFYPGATINRVDVRVNGEVARIQNFADDETYAAAKEAAKSSDLKQFARKNMNVYSKALKLKNTANYKLQSMEEFIIYYAGRTSSKSITTSSIGIDDLKASWGYYKADIPSITPANKGVIDILSADKFLAQNGKSVDEIKAALTNSGDVRIYTDATYANEQTESVVTGNKIVVQNGAILKYFTIDTSDFVKDGNTIKSLARSADDKLYVALYDDADATKISSVISATAEKPGIIGKEVPASIKAFKPFLWNSLLVPYFGAGETYNSAE